MVIVVNFKQHGAKLWKDERRRTKDESKCAVLKNVYTNLVNMLKDNRTVKNYSESFKLKVLSEIESGKYTKSEVCKVYSIEVRF